MPNKAHTWPSLGYFHVRPAYMAITSGLYFKCGMPHLVSTRVNAEVVYWSLRSVLGTTD